MPPRKAPDSAAKGANKRSAPPEAAPKPAKTARKSVNGDASTSAKEAEPQPTPTRARRSATKEATPAKQVSPVKKAAAAAGGGKKKTPAPVTPDAKAKLKGPLAKIKAAEGKKASASPASSRGGGTPRKAKVVEGLNALPVAAAHLRPARVPLVHGTGDSGQFGLPEPFEAKDDTIKRPRIHQWFEKVAKPEGLLGAVGAGLEMIVAGGLHSLAIDEEGKVWSWGVNDNGALGRVTAKVVDKENPGSFIDNQLLERQPTVIKSLVDEGYRAVKVATGDSISLALDAQGEVRIWGSIRGDEGLLGFNGVSKAIQFKPIPLPNLHDLKKHKFADIACGDNHALLLTTSGALYTLGAGSNGALGRKRMPRGSSQMSALQPHSTSLSNIVKIGCGNNSSYAVDKDGQFFGWGMNSHGQTGAGKGEDVTEYPTRCYGFDSEDHAGSPVKEIVGGDHFVLVLYENGEVWGVGDNGSYQLAVVDSRKKAAEVDEVTRSVYDPVRIPFPAEPEDPDDDATDVAPFVLGQNDTTYFDNAAHIVAIGAGTRAAFAVTEGGYPFSWGVGAVSELGHGEEDEFETPTWMKNTATKSQRILDCSANGQHCFLIGVPREE